MRIVPRHLWVQLMFRTDQAKLDQQLAAVANAQAQGVFAGKEIAERFPGFFIVQERTRPAFGRAKHVGIAETSHKGNHIYIFQRFPSRDEIGHMNILHIHTGHIHSPGHVAVTVYSLLADDGSLHAGGLAAFKVYAVLLSISLEFFRETEFYGLVLVIGIAIKGQFFAALFTVEEVRGFKPNIPVMVCIK